MFRSHSPLRTQRRLFQSAATVILLSALACDKTAPPAPVAQGTAPAEAPKPPARVRHPKPAEWLLPVATGLPAERRAIQVSMAEERVVDADAARAKGMVIVDLRDDWAPSLFEDGATADGKPLINRYRQVFVGLANDRTDGDGQPLPPGQKNFLELYGIPPSLSVLRERFLADEGRDCSSVDNVALLGTNNIPAWGDRTEREEQTKHQKRHDKLTALVQELGLPDIAALGASTDPSHTKGAKEARVHMEMSARVAAFAEVEKRMLCEGRMDPQKHKPGKFDTALRMAVVEFQEENMLLDRTDIGRGTLEAMARGVGENNLAALRRAIAERAAHSGGILEDGSVLPKKQGAPAATYTTTAGEEKPIPDLVTAATNATLDWLGIETADDATAFFKRHSQQDFRWLKVAVPFPQKPEYYAEHMDLQVEIDRGDIWYDVPYDNAGNKLPQPRRILPSLTLYTRWNNQKIPLVKWRSTIGGWRAEMAGDGHEYLRYKGSDVGPRVWRHIVAAPVWIPPESTPLGGMIKERWVNGRPQWVTNYDEVGPGYLSAYGLAMAINVEKRTHRDGQVTYFDNGIRVHGSSDYRSLLGRYSHGCHRLYNNLAVRLFSFVLGHRKMQTMGPVTLDFRRTFYRDDKTFDLRLPVRGYYYLLDPPVPVEVFEGNIKGNLKKPIESYVRKPGEEYPSERPPPVGGTPQDRAGGAAPAEGNEA